MNHSVSISDSYSRATEAEVLEDYLKAIDFDNKWSKQTTETSCSSKG
jgi:hypothetical protein